MLIRACSNYKYISFLFKVSLSVWRTPYQVGDQILSAGNYLDLNLAF
jgi:hypothetical protein